jgi:plastocyanin
VASASSTGWHADVVAFSVTDGGAVYLSATDPGGVFRLEVDMTTLRPWVEGGRVLGLDSSGDDTRLLFAAPETSPARPAEQIRAVLGGVAQRWATTYGPCAGADPAQPRTAPQLPRDVALLPVANGIDSALVVDSNHVVWLQSRFGDGRPLFGVPCESGNDATHLNGPRAVAIDNLGNVFISDTGNGRVVILPKPGAAAVAAPKAKAGAPAVQPALTPTPAPPSTSGSGIPAPLTSVDFGNPGACPPFGRCPEADVMLPPDVTVRAGDSVRFNIRGLTHQVAIYAPGTLKEHIDLNALGGVTGTPGGGATIIDSMRRVTTSPSFPFLQPAVAEWDWDTRGLAPGTYLVICTFKPHFDTGMIGTVTLE